MKDKEKKLKKETGQSTIEFLVSFSVIFTILLTFVRIAFNATNGFYAHYAVFNASRAYLVSDENNNSIQNGDSSAIEKAKEVYDRFKVEYLIGGARPELMVNNPGSFANKPFIGNYISFKMDFGVSSMIGGKGPITLISESFLGREPSRQECIERICEAFSSIDGGGCSSHTTIYDNGC
tara:strand:+ start:74 stop:610 length:537 start_codon:yes stop_codon:yes gene_type:complete